jgi:hypothetical protein
MAQEIVGIKLETDTRSLRSQFKEAMAELAKLQNQAGATSKEIANAAKKAAEIKDRIGDAKSTIDAFNPDAKFKAFGQAITGVAGAFAAAQGAFALFGIESENVQKQLLKVQGALALTQGLNSVLESIDGFKNLTRVIREEVITALTTLKGALVATGIGVLSIAVGYLIGHWTELTNKLIISFPILSKIGDAIGNITNKVTDFIGVTSQADRDYEKSNEIFLKRKAIIESQIELLSAQGNKEKEIYNLKKDLVNEEIVNLENKNKTVAGLSKDEKNELIKKQNELLVLDASYKKFQLEQQKIANDKRKKEQEEADNKFNDNLQKEGATQFDNFKKLTEEKNQIRYDELQTEIDTLERSNDIKQNDYEQDIIRLELTKERYLEQKDLELKAVENTENAEIKKLQIKKKYADILFNIDQKVFNTTKALEDAKIKYKKTKADKEIEIAQSLGYLLKQIANGNKEIAIAGVIIEQAAAIAKIVQNTQVANAEALVASPLTGGQPFVAFNYIQAGLSVASSIAAGINAINQIRNADSGNISTSAPSLSSGGSAPISPSYTAPQATRLDQQSLNTISNVVARAYVVESDISGVTKRISRIENAARI